MKKIQFVRKVVGAFTFLSAIVFTQSVYAATKINVVRGTTNLLTDFAAWLPAIVITSGSVGIAWQAVMKNISDNDPTVNAQRDSKKKKILVSTVIGTAAAGIISGVTAYFK